MPRSRAHSLVLFAAAASTATLVAGCKTASTHDASATRAVSLRPADAPSDLAYFDALDAASMVSLDDAVRGVLAVTGKDTSGNAAARVARAKEAGLLSEAAGPDATAVSLGQAAGLVVRGSGGEAANQDEAVARLRENGLIHADAAASEPATGPQLFAMLSGLRSRLAAGGGSFGPARATPVAVLESAPAPRPAAPPTETPPPPPQPAASPVAVVESAPPPPPPPPAPPAPPAAPAVVSATAAPASAPASAPPAATPELAPPPPAPPAQPTPPPAPAEAAPVAAAAPPPPPAPPVKPGKSPFTRGTPIPK